MSEHDHLDHAAADCRYQAAIEHQEHALFALLKPTLQPDGNKWVVVLGDNITVGVSGVGDSPYLAVMDFNREWYKSIDSKGLEEPSEIFPGTRDALDSLTTIKT